MVIEKESKFKEFREEMKSWGYNLDGYSDEELELGAKTLSNVFGSFGVTTEQAVQVFKKINARVNYGDRSKRKD